MTKKTISIILISIFAIGVIAAISGCTMLFPGAEAADEAATTEPPTGLQGVFANYGTWIWLAVLAVAFYFLLIRPQRMRSKKAQDLVGNLKRGDEIVTIGGFHGRIKDVRDDNIIITIAGGVDVKISKSAVARVINSQGSVDTNNKM